MCVFLQLTRDNGGTDEAVKVEAKEEVLAPVVEAAGETVGKDEGQAPATVSLGGNGMGTAPATPSATSMMTPGPGLADADAVQLDAAPAPGQQPVSAEVQMQQRRNLANTLMLMLHASNCALPQCQPQCLQYRTLLAHIKTCVARPCQIQGCQHTRNLVTHFRNCNLPTCVCPGVRQHYQDEMNRRRQELVCKARRVFSV
jgi:hypothetical protein